MITKWQYNILKLLGINPLDNKRGSIALAGATKHNRQHTRPADYRRKRKTRRLMARASRRRNRP